MLTLVELLTSIAGFGLLAATADLHQQGRALSLAARVFGGILRAIGSAGIVTSGVVSIIDFGWMLGLVAWVGWLTSGALAGIAILALTASLRKPRFPPAAVAAAAASRDASTSTSSTTNTPMPRSYNTRLVD